MSTEYADELLSLIKQTQEHVTYFHELNVAGVEPQPSQSMEIRKHAATHSSGGAQLPSAAPSSPTEGSLAPNRPSFLKEAVDATLRQQERPAAPTLPQDSLFDDLALPEETIAKSAENLDQIWADLGGCTRCPLHQGRSNIVNTEGNRKARLMFVGEAPGADEDAQARPFVGRAGQLLTKIIESLGLKRDEVLIGNVNRCRPPGNRPPTQEEAAMCKPFLLREIASVQPEVIVVLGNTAMKNLLETKEGITRLRGKFQDYKGLKIMPTFHPAYLLRDPSKKRETWEDLKKVRDYLDGSAKRESGI